ncbi:MAG: hypothetical protein U9P14_10530, partial [Gemmatimonadota bacterium]|nr:hypothetical protein [Gemmatimonadota bacterium]
PKLAEYPSVYGFDFREAPPVKARLKDAIIRHLPVFLRPGLRRFRAKRRSKEVLTYFMQKEYIKTVLDLRNIWISDYVHLDQIKDPNALNRALTVELLVQDVF